MCKKESKGNPNECLLEGRKVTKCSLDIISKLQLNCGEEFKSHAACLDYNNQILYKCRPEEKKFNSCVYSKLVI